ncbi:hypothetical protein RHECNPAF_280060 [Rhizobium etli CNPAF512]|nr:hypothetical protein RHECNPAF_280060 [Rhizobium etli CNPAF512]
MKASPLDFSGGGPNFHHEPLRRPGWTCFFMLPNGQYRKGMIRSSPNIYGIAVSPTSQRLDEQSAVTFDKRGSREKVPIKNPARRPGFFTGKTNRLYAASSCESSSSMALPRFGPLLRLVSTRRTASVSDILLTAAISRAMRSSAAS